MAKLLLIPTLLAALALQARVNADDDISSSAELGNINDVEPSAAASYSYPPIFYPWGFMADASYNLKLDIARTKSDGGAANYGIEIDGACAQYTPEPKTITYTRYEFSEPHLMTQRDDGDNSGYSGDRDHSDLDLYSGQVFTTVFTPYFPQIGCSGVYRAEYSDSSTQYESSEEYASKYPEELLWEPLQAIGEDEFLGYLDSESGGFPTDVADDTDGDVDFDDVDIGQFFSTLAEAAQGEATIASVADDADIDPN